MKIPFYKMHGAGNDFILIDDRSLDFPAHDTAFLSRIATRRTGIGCEGIILIQPSRSADLRMRFFNPDGLEQDLCGNGARCLARLAFELGVAPANMRIETMAGEVEAEVIGNQVRLLLPPASDSRLGLQVEPAETVDFINTGVPHAVVRVARLEHCDVDARGRTLRHHPLFAPKGTNADFLQLEKDASLSIRTYERGVEAETLACGTGAAAAALVAHRHGWVQLPVTVHCRGGDLQVDLSGEQIVLAGGAEHIFKGEMEYGDRI